MTTDGTYLIYDDGGNVLYFMDPNSFKIVKSVEVNDEHGPVTALNELEYIKGFIYANQWQSDYIYKIDPATGRVVGRANLYDLRQKTGIPYPVASNEDVPEVMNGIAYDATGNRIFVTGKNWPKLIEVKRKRRLRDTEFDGGSAAVEPFCPVQKFPDVFEHPRGVEADGLALLIGHGNGFPRGRRSDFGRGFGCSRTQAVLGRGRESVPKAQ